MRLLSLAAELLLAASMASAARPGERPRLGAPAMHIDAPSPADGVQKRADSPIHWAWFDQLLDHSKPELGTFKQLYYYNYEDYAGPGSPIIMNSPGENNATGWNGYVTNSSLAGNFAKSVGGATILLEHRYWGYSSPYANLTTDNLQHLTLDQHLHDLVYFARNVNLTFDPAGSSKPDKAPWVLTGCSYSGAVTAWLHTLYPGTYWAYHASSAVVEIISDFWQYQAIVHDAMPQNCSADYSKVIAHVDKVLANGTEAQKTKLKKKFGFEPLNDVDFAMALQDGGYLSQNLGFGDEKYKVTDGFHRFCDYIENRWPGSKAPQPGPEGVGLCAAINGLSKWFREIDIPNGCASWGYSRWTDEMDVGCWVNDDFTSPVYRDTKVNNGQNRQWQWMLCNEPFEFWRTGGAPADQPRMASKLVTVDVWRRQCDLYFPEVNGAKVGIRNGRTYEQINALTGGWGKVDTERLMWCNAENDPWRPATVSSPWRPDGMLASTEAAPIHVVAGGAHCPDMLKYNADANDGLKQVWDAEIEQVKKWVGEFYAEKKTPWPKYQ
ncbi:serine peptidase [Cordyceps javanica]|uniref:Serine peptidase n=1 Tax=Cordyceps javanica TaxID=43265 RepID=A0A545VWV8_9HYPO|nr:serine peptidase [Cordyceps javanica]TQW06211.1 serine peptidase [Cordyceps javanica]